MSAQAGSLCLKLLQLCCALQTALIVFLALFLETKGVCRKCELNKAKAFFFKIKTHFCNLVNRQTCKKRFYGRNDCGRSS
jgi:hypothetical protein